MSIVLDPASAPQEAAPREPLVHWTEPPYTHGLCGTLLSSGVDDSFEISCVVCAELGGED